MDNNKFVIIIFGEQTPGSCTAIFFKNTALEFWKSKVTFTVDPSAQANSKHLAVNI